MSVHIFFPQFMSPEAGVDFIWAEFWVYSHIFQGPTSPVNCPLPPACLCPNCAGCHQHMAAPTPRVQGNAHEIIYLNLFLVNILFISLIQNSCNDFFKNSIISASYWIFSSIMPSYWLIQLQYSCKQLISWQANLKTQHKCSFEGNKMKLTFWGILCEVSLGFMNNCLQSNVMMT